MFLKYLNRFQKAEAEWVLEVLDMHDGDYARAVEAIKGSLNRLTINAPEVAELKAFDDCIAAAFFASRDWWPIGIERLRELGKLPDPARTGFFTR